jgi:transcriptional regulator with XRE-family HTH domain
MTKLLMNRLRQWRVGHGLTLEELSDLTGYDVSTLSRLERGERQLRPLNRVKIARLLGVPVRELFDVPQLAEESHCADGSPAGAS